MYINSVLTQEFSLDVSTVNTITNTCLIGNSQNQSDPAELEIRHFLMLTQALNTSSDIRSRSQVVSLPNATNVGVYFDMGRNF